MTSALIRATSYAWISLRNASHGGATGCQARRVTSFVRGEIEAVPAASGSFDGIMANHVLYHVRNIPLGAHELARAPRPNGWLLATTNSDRVRVPLIEIHHQALEQLGAPMARERESPFSMENGEALLRTAFVTWSASTSKTRRPTRMHPTSRPPMRRQAGIVTSSPHLKLTKRSRGTAADFRATRQ